MPYRRSDTEIPNQFMWCGQKKGRDAWVGLLIKIDHQIIIEEPDFNTAQVMAVNLNIFGYKIRLVIGYSLTKRRWQ